ncbi:MAG: hypothetical protein ACJ74Z_07500 [Bryobacteraceae bacterium]
MPSHHGWTTTKIKRGNLIGIEAIRAVKHTLSGTYLYVTSGFHLNPDNPCTQSYPYFKVGRLEIQGTANGGLGNAREVLSGNPLE